MISRSFAIAAGLLILAAVAHVTIVLTGGYGASHSWLTIAVAFGVAAGSVCCGAAWNKGAHILAVMFALCIASGEAYNFLQSANRLMAATEAAQAPKREHVKAYAKAEDDVRAAEAAVRAATKSQRLTDALKAKELADAGVLDKSAERGCRDNCRQLLQAAVDSAAGEIVKARAALESGQREAEAKLRTAKATLEGMRAPESPTPFADNIGMAPWAFNVLLAGLGSIAINGLGCCLMVFGTHSPRQRAAELPEPSSAPVALPSAHNVAAVIARVMEPGRGKLALEQLYGRYVAACQAQGADPVTPAEFAAPAKVFCDAAGIKTLIDGRRIYLTGVRLALDRASAEPLRLSSTARLGPMHRA